jgi:membrane protease YdiL (CAAX protease family)
MSSYNARVTNPQSGITMDTGEVANANDPGLRPLLLLTAALHVTWTLWVLLLLRFPHSLDETWVRLTVRLIVWVLPALAYLHYILRQPVLSGLSLDRHLLRGLAWGVIGSLIPIAMAAWQLHYRGKWTWPLSLDLWRNPIVAAPIAEEVFFRGLLFRQIARRKGVLMGMLVSSASFVLLHLPYWALGGMYHGWGLAIALGRIFLYGIGFALLLWISRSLVAPLLAHFVNNLLSFAVA